MSGATVSADLQMLVTVEKEVLAELRAEREVLRTERQAAACSQATLYEGIRTASRLQDKLLESLTGVGECLEKLDAIVQAFGLLLDRTSRRLLEQGIQEMLDEEIGRREKARNATVAGGVPRKLLQ